jgi:hypothetical protein
MLIFYVVLCLVIVAGCLVIAKSNRRGHLTILTVAILASLLVPWGVYSITAAIAKNDDQTFNEYWNGSEVSATYSSVRCEKNGRCQHHYDCDPHPVTTIETYTDEKGNAKTRPVTKTEYDSCPYSQEETTYTINTTVGKFTAGDSLMTGVEFRGNKGIPGGRQNAPVLWIEAKNRIESGNPSGVTARHSYKNFILSADVTLFKNYSDKIEDLQKEGLLPTPASTVRALYQADKVYNVGNTKVDVGEMNRQLTQLNAYVGAELRGDTHVVFVEASKAGDKTDYTNALKAHWTGPEIGKNAISKNALVLVVGVEQKDGKPTASWATGFTGMPVGNEGLIQEFSNLKGVAIEGNFIGSPKFNPAAKSYVLSGGKVESMITGTHKFDRVSMSASDENDKGSGFSYLSESWQMKPAALAVAIWVSSILSVMILAIGTLINFNMGRSSNDPVKDFIQKLFSKN